MIPSEIESETDVHDSNMSETLSVTSESDSSFNNGAAEITRKLNKFRSIKLVKLPSIRFKSPNYMKTTTSSTAKKDTFQKLARSLSRRSSFKPPRSLTRLPSTKLRRPFVRKSSGGSDPRKKMNKSRSIKLRNRSSVVLSHDPENDQFQARTSSVRPLRVLKKMSSLRINSSSMKKTDRNIERATCSSTLKGSKFPNRLELQSGGNESHGISTIKVCPYTYCSLHGHSHSTLPPLKRFVSMRRRVLRTQTSGKLERQSSLKAKRSSNVKKGIRGRKMSGYGDAAVPETSNASKVRSPTRKMAGPRIREEIFARDGKGTSCSDSDIEDVLGELSDNLRYTQEYPQQSEIPEAETDSMTSSYEEISVNGEVHHEVNEETSCTLNLADGRGDLESITLEENTSAGEASRSIDSTVSSVPICEQLEESAACEEKNGDYFPKTDSESDCNTRADYKRKMEEQKHMGLWHLIYKHMASGNAVEDKEEVEDADTSPGTQKSGSSDFSGSSRGLDVDNNHEQGSHIQLYQQNAIKLVKEAFDTILSEIPDQSPDDQSSDSGSSQNKEFSEKNHDGEETSMPNSFHSRKEGMTPEPEKTMLVTDTTNGVEVDKTQSEIGSKSKQETPRKWSYLKKMIVLNRFVKALDKAKKFNPRKPQFLPIPSDPEAEKVHLRHQSLEEKKKSEEWMLDYALQQVISTLAPSQKRKVALLVQAFESVSPGPSSNLDDSSQATQDESCIGLSNQKSFGKGEETYFGITLHKTSLPNKRSDENLHHTNGSCTEEQAPDCFSKLKELNSESSFSSEALSLQVTDADSKKAFGVIDLDENNHNSIVKDHQSDPINCCLVQDVPKLADGENTSNGVFENGEVSESVRDLHLEFNDQKDVADTSNDVFSDRQFSVWEVRNLGLGFSDQHDIANTPNVVLANREVSASGAGDLQFSEIPTAETDNSTSSHDEISLSGEVNHEVDEEKSSTLNLADGGGDLESITCEVSRSIDNTISSISICEQLEAESAACEENIGDYSPETDFESDHSTHLDKKQEVEEQKHMGLWRLIYKHMESGITAVVDVQTSATETDKEEVEDADTCTRTRELGSSDFSGIDHGLDIDNNHEQGSHIQLYQRNAIKLVKEAFDKILSEIPDQPPDDQSSDTGSRWSKEFAEKNHDMEGSSNLTSFNSRKEGMAQEPEKNMLNTAVADGPEEEKTHSEKGSKSKQETPRNWSYLKKMIVLNRFVKALDKAKKFNPRKPRFLPIPSDPEAEKVHLRHQSLEEKKKSEEWMLDYALQQVISTLAPSQKRKVALLVQAFESVGPSPTSNLDAPSQDVADTSNDVFADREVSASKVHDLDLGFDDQHDIANREVSASEVHDLDLGLNDQYDVLASGQISESEVQDQHEVANTTNDVLANGVHDSKIRGLGLGFNDQHDVTNTLNDVGVNGEISTSEVLDLDLGFNKQELPSNYQNNRKGEQSGDAQDSSANGDVNSLVSVTELVEKSSKVTNGETVLRNKFLQLVTPESPHEESKASSTELTHEKQGNMGLWHLIYKHMVSGTTTLLDEAERMNNTDDHQVAGSQKVNFQQIEAIRMVEQAIDEIPLPDFQDDSPDDHSIRSPEQEQIKKSPFRVSVSTEADPKERSLNSGGTATEDGDNNAFRVENNTQQKTRKSWSNLKKMILLRRFVTALEKVKTFNPREPRLLPLDSEKESEKVLLKHQDMEDRKNGDEWMLDYALQQVVTKLTPARKRKVQLLVEAFETVIPT
ncbi:calmodulin binding [Euphorbia peplus]|nr:calmodulin binding [Euphorbia peplus]